MVVCSLLASPIILDLVLLAELTTRIKMKRDGQQEAQSFHPVAVLLSYLTKVPRAPPPPPPTHHQKNMCTSTVGCIFSCRTIPSRPLHGPFVERSGD